MLISGCEIMWNYLVSFRKSTPKIWVSETLSGFRREAENLSESLALIFTVCLVGNPCKKLGLQQCYWVSWMQNNEEKHRGLYFKMAVYSEVNHHILTVYKSQYHHIPLVVKEKTSIRPLISRGGNYRITELQNSQTCPSDKCQKKKLLVQRLIHLSHGKITFYL